MVYDTDFIHIMHPKLVTQSPVYTRLINQCTYNCETNISDISINNFAQNAEQQFPWTSKKTGYAYFYILSMQNICYSKKILFNSYNLI